MAKLLIIKMANMSIKGSQDGRNILLHVNWNTNYEIAIFVNFSLIPLFHTGHESPESPRIDFFLIRGDS